MKRFQWRLQSVLDVKRKQEQLKRVELFELNDKIKTLQLRLTQQREILMNAINALARENPRQRLEKQGFFMTYTQRNDMMIQQLESDIQALTVQRDAKRNEVMELRKLTEGLDKLRTKAEQEFISEQEKQEQKAADEMTTYRVANDRLHTQTVESATA